MSVHKRWVLLLGLVASWSVQAGLVITESQTDESANNKSSRTVSRVTLEGDRARSDILEMTESSPMIGPGSYILVAADKPGMLVVNPATRSYMRMDPRDFQGMQQGLAAAEKNVNESGGQAEVSDLKVEKKTDEAGPAMLGLPTRHLVYQVSYRRPIGMKVMGLSMMVVEKHDLWVTSALDAKLASYTAFKSLAAGLSRMGSGFSSQLVEVERQIGQNGFALKSTTSSETKMHSAIPNMATMFARGGGTTRSSMEVTELREEPVGADLLSLPKGFTEREMMNPTEGSMPDLNQMPSGKGPSPTGTTPGMPDLNNIPH